MSVSRCCITGFEWNGEPNGHTIPFPTSSNQAYVTGSSSSVAILFICDLFGWEFRNNRLLADHLAQAVGATVYVPDFFNDDPLPVDILTTREPPWPELNLDQYLTTNSREARSPEILECARHLRAQYPKVGAIGYCYGGWAGFYLASEEHNPANGSQPLLDCLTIGHPSLLTEADIDSVSSRVPIQVLAPEFDAMYVPYLKAKTFKVLREKNNPFEYRHFPGVEHACFIRGDPKKAGERDAMDRGLRAAVSWMSEWLTSSSSNAS
jgi:dienelactone hydrolase